MQRWSGDSSLAEDANPEDSELAGCKLGDEDKFESYVRVAHDYRTYKLLEG